MFFLLYIYNVYTRRCVFWSLKSYIIITYFRDCYFDGHLLWHGHDDVIKWKHFSRCWTLVRGIHRCRVNSPHKVQGRGALMFSLICAWTNCWANNGDAGDLRRHRAHYDVIVMDKSFYAVILTKYVHPPCRLPLILLYINVTFQF